MQDGNKKMRPIAELALNFILSASPPPWYTPHARAAGSLAGAISGSAAAAHRSAGLSNQFSHNAICALCVTSERLDYAARTGARCAASQQ